MLRKRYRLKREIKFLDPKTLNTPFFTVRIAKNDLSYSRFGFIVSKKIDKRATVRNSLKRHFRLCLEMIFDNIQKGYDVLFILKKDARAKVQSELCKTLRALLKREELLI